MKKIITTITIILSLHLWYSNSDLLIATKELAIGIENVSMFSYVVLTLFALSYSVLTSVAVVKMKHYANVLVFALLDGFAVYLRINVDQEHFIFITSVFYAVYTAYIISVCWLLNRQYSQPQANQIALKKKTLYDGLSEVQKAEYNAKKLSINGSKRNPEKILAAYNSTNDIQVLNALKEQYGEVKVLQKSLEL